MGYFLHRSCRKEWLWWHKLPWGKQLLRSSEDRRQVGPKLTVNWSWHGRTKFLLVCGRTRRLHGHCCCRVCGRFRPCQRCTLSFYISADRPQVEFVDEDTLESLVHVIIYCTLVKLWFFYFFLTKMSFWMIYLRKLSFLINCKIAEWV